jgi:hypothetical protein
VADPKSVTSASAAVKPATAISKSPTVVAKTVSKPAGVPGTAPATLAARSITPSKAKPQQAPAPVSKEPVQPPRAPMAALSSRVSPPPVLAPLHPQQGSRDTSQPSDDQVQEMAISEDRVISEELYEQIHGHQDALAGEDEGRDFAVGGSGDSEGQHQEWAGQEPTHDFGDEVEGSSSFNHEGGDERTERYGQQEGENNEVQEGENNEVQYEGNDNEPAHTYQHGDEGKQGDDEEEPQDLIQEEYDPESGESDQEGIEQEGGEDGGEYQQGGLDQDDNGGEDNIEGSENDDGEEDDNSGGEDDE